MQVLARAFYLCSRRKTYSSWVDIKTRGKRGKAKMGDGRVWLKYEPK
jgi:hypothetical protein